MSVKNKKVYLAPSVLFAFLDRSHAKNSQASAFFRYFAQENYQLFTDIVSVYEAYRQIYNDMSPSIAKELMRTISMSNITMLYPDERDMNAALKLYVNDRSSDLTYQTALMAVLADKRGVSHICTFDYLHAVYGLSVFYIPI